MRKQSSLTHDYDMGGPNDRPKPTGEAKPKDTTTFVEKLIIILDDLVMHPQAVYFKEPVDPIELNIPDYPLMITKPMDLGTIKKKLLANEYKTATECANDVRLTFKNAVLYNAVKTNPVHIAAKAIAKLFEEKYKAVLGVNRAPKQPRLTGSSYLVHKKKISRPNYQQQQGYAQPMLISGGMDMVASATSMQGLQEMHAAMLKMQSELLQLRGAAERNKISKTLAQKQLDAQNPLTYEEKLALLKGIHNIGPQYMPSILQIVQQALPGKKLGSSGSANIPLDELDQYTLRQLQRFVEGVQPHQRHK
jgi:hypothetical protein